MNLLEFEVYLHEHIPLSLAMQVSVLEANSNQVTLCAPLAPNINHRETVFGGSASALTILSAWALIHTKLTACGFKCTLVIQRNTMSYEKAVTGRFSAQATAPSAEAWELFTRMLQRKGRARISVSSLLTQDGHVAGHFEGEFVAIGANATSKMRGASLL
ncbi:MAG: YiiD C-terminal domain-containing protein [Gallionella sp.]|nr:YiiD C-terminal domain-containing protein [Gallionella sp.]